MAVPVNISPVTLETLEFLPYINGEGLLPQHLHGKVGVYAIFDGDRQLQYIGYSRDIGFSLKLHLVRQSEFCHWVKAELVARPSRTLLEGMRTAWLEEWGSTPSGNLNQPSPWETPIDVEAGMTEEERANYADPNLDDRGRIKAMKQAARRIEAEILAQLTQRNLQEPLRFHPKLKETGILDLKHM